MYRYVSWFVLLVSYCFSGVSGANGGDFILRPETTGDNGFSWVSLSHGAKWPSKDANGVTRIKWHFNNVVQGKDTSALQLLSVVNVAMSNWESVCNIKFDYQGTTAAITSDSIGIKPDKISAIGFKPGNTLTMGITSTIYNIEDNDTYSISEADLTIYDNYSDFLGREPKFQVLQGTVTHELGHFLGLDHSDKSESIMYAAPYHTGAYNVVIRQDDIDGCVAKYGKPKTVGTQKYTQLDINPVVDATGLPAIVPTTVVPSSVEQPRTPTSADISVTETMSNGRKTLEIDFKPGFRYNIPRAHRFLVAHYNGYFFGWNKLWGIWWPIKDILNETMLGTAVSSDFAKDGAWPEKLTVSYYPGTVTGVQLYLAYGLTLKQIAIDKTYALAYEIKD